MTSHSLVHRMQRHAETYSSIIRVRKMFQFATVNVEAAVVSETLLRIYQSTRSYIAETRNLDGS